MSATETAVCEDEPEFKQIIRNLATLAARLNTVKCNTVQISDLLIGAQVTGQGLDDSVKPTAPEYFTIRCFSVMDDLRTEVEQLEAVNNRLLRHIQEVE